MRRGLSAAALAVAVSVSAAVMAGEEIRDAVGDLNRSIVKILAPYQSASTRAELVFRRIVTGLTRAETVALEALYSKTGTHDTLTVRIPNLSYDFGDMVDPALKARLEVGLDLLRLFGQNELNEFGAAAEDIAKIWADGYVAEYGKAAEVEAKVEDKVTDAAGNIVSLRLSLMARIDLTQLPATVKVEDVSVRKFRLTAEIGIKGITIDIGVKINPRYSAFEDDQAGLKEYLEKLLAQDPALLQEISEMYKELDEAVEGIVSPKRTEQPDGEEGA